MITSAYIHIPFCDHLCTYCDFCKRYTNDKIIDNYLKALELEIKDYYQGEKLKTLYIGGGTPSSLSVSSLQKLMKITSLFTLDSDCEFTFEVNPENISEEKIILLKKSGVNRISMGIESTNPKFLQYLGRSHDFHLVEEKIQLIKKYISNINVDLIYAIPNETILDLQNDLNHIMKLNINHISTYSLEIHENTILGIKKTNCISDELDRKMYDFICRYLKKHDFNHYEISNFCKNDTYSRHNLVYWQNKEYYGFGLGASGYIKTIRYDNTRSMYKYVNSKRRLNEENLSIKDQMIYELILGFRLINGINKKVFKEKYHEDLIEQYNIRELIDKGYLVDDGKNIKVSYSKIYVENSILENFIN